MAAGRVATESCRGGVAAALPLAPSSVRTLHRPLSSLLSSAVEDERIPRNPADRAHLPKVDDRQVVPMTADEVGALIAATAEHVRAVVPSAPVPGNSGRREPDDRPLPHPSRRPAGARSPQPAGGRSAGCAALQRSAPAMTDSCPTRCDLRSFHASSAVTTSAASVQHVAERLGHDLQTLRHSRRPRSRID